MAKRSAIEVGVISDTHGLLRPAALAALAGVAHIVHAGDVGSAEVLEALARVAPVTAVRGNNDRGPWADRLPERGTLELGGIRLLVVHDRSDLTGEDVASHFDVIVSGHSHRPAIERRGDVMYVNPGSAGPRRFKLPIALARLGIGPGGITGQIVELDAGA
jgi:putative phosphoesterase